MSGFTVQHLTEEGIIRVHLQGRFDAKLLSTVTLKLAEEISRCNCTRMLMDHREATLHLSTVDIFDRPKIASKIGVPYGSKIAIVYSIGENEYQFVETVGRNGGFDVKVFTDIGEGIKWLKTR